MVKVLVVNNTPETCGVHQYGENTYNHLSKSTKLDMCCVEADNWNDVRSAISYTNPSVILYNWHSYTMPWADDAAISEYPVLKHVAVVHEAGMQVSSRMIRVEQDSLPRALFSFDDTYVETSIPVIGSFGFASWHKGWHNLILKIQDQFDEAIFKLHIPPSYYCDPNAEHSREIVAEVQKRITKPRIVLDASYDFLSVPDLLKWLNQNTLNAFHYEPLPYNPGNSSVLDLAISAKRPIAITKSPMFRHISGAVPSIFLEDVPMKEIIANGIAPLRPFYEKWSEDNFIKHWESILC